MFSCSKKSIIIRKEHLQDRSQLEGSCQHVFLVPCIYQLLLSVMSSAGRHLELIELDFSE